MLDGIVESLVGLFREHWGLLLAPAVLLFWRQRGALGGARAAPLHAPALPPEIVEACTARITPEGAAAARDRVFPDQDPRRVERMFAEFGFAFASDGSFDTYPPPHLIRLLVEAIFAPADREAVLDQLERYGRASHEQSRGRVWLDILKVSGGDPARVRALVREAKSDFRDVIVMAENPHLHQGVTEARGEAVRTLLDPLSHVHRSVADADLRQFGMWLLQYVK